MTLKDCPMCNKSISKKTEKILKVHNKKGELIDIRFHKKCFMELGKSLIKGLKIKKENER